MRTNALWAAVMAGCLLTAAPAVAQRGMGDAEGMARNPQAAEYVDLSGTVSEVVTGPCEMTTGRAAVGAHVIVQSDTLGRINVHLGPAAAVEALLDHLEPGVALTAEAFRTDRMPADAYVAKTVHVGDADYVLRGDDLRPAWAIGPRGGGQQRGQRPGFGATGAGGGGQRCWW